MKSFCKVLSLLAIIVGIQSADIFMATNGNDNTGDGSIQKPFKTLMKCQEKANAGDTVYIRGGTYKNFAIAASDNVYNYIHKFTKSGITYRGYNKEKVVFDFEFARKYTLRNGKPTQRVNAFLIAKNTHDITFKDFDCTRVPVLSYDEVVALGGKKLTQSECFTSYGKNVHFDRMNAYNNQGIGFYFLGTNSYNVAYRCDAYNNKGRDKASYGNADGFGAHGTGAKFLECRGWDNGDDNFDCINSFGRNVFDTCWAFRYKFTFADIEDGNGFKVGGFNKDPKAKDKYGPYSGPNPPVHIVKNCISTMNKANGFYSNHQPGKAATWYNNRAYFNKANFDMTEGHEQLQVDSAGRVIDICGTREALFFNIAHKYHNLRETGSMYGKEGNLYNARIPDKNNRNNSWNFRDIKITEQDFLSLDVAQLAAPRGPNGELPKINFMQLNPKGPNYKKLRSIEVALKSYTLNDDGSVVKN